MTGSARRSVPLLTVGGKDYVMGEPGSARRFAVKVLAAAGVPWKLPPFSWAPV
jgi:hypothetical protein